MPPSVSKTDRVIDTMPNKWRVLIYTKYIHRRPLSKRQYVEMDRVHYYIMGRIEAIMG